MTAVAVVAVLARAQLAVHHAGLTGLQGYDDGVYYAGAAALVSGRMPYSDFVFLHPPGILIALSPFAALGAVTSDPTGLAAARVAFWLIGGINAALVARVAARHGRLAAVVGGLCYALSYPAIFAERTPLLEPLGNTGLLIALLLLGRRGESPSARAGYLAGAALGLTACVKIWMVVPLAVVFLWQLVERGRRSALRVALGAIAAAAVVLLPFAGSGSALLRMVVLDQLGRPSEGAFVPRVTGITGLRPWSPLLGDLPTLGALAVVGVVGVAAVVAAWRTGGPARWYVVLLATTVLFLLVTPPYFEHYPTFAAVPWALVLAVLVGSIPVRAAAGAGRRIARPRRAMALALSVGLVALWAPTLRLGVGEPFPRAPLAAAVAHRPCVVSDVPTALAAMDVLTRDLRRGCPPVVDVLGPSYDRLAVKGPGTLPDQRTADPRWQQHLATFLPSGSAMLVLDPEVTGVNATTMSRLSRLPVLAEVDGVVLREGTLPAPAPHRRGAPSRREP
jgi:alpha-1,2-mannosyltransferase